MDSHAWSAYSQMGTPVVVVTDGAFCLYLLDFMQSIRLAPNLHFSTQNILDRYVSSFLNLKNIELFYFIYLFFNIFFEYNCFTMVC